MLRSLRLLTRVIDVVELQFANLRGLYHLHDSFAPRARGRVKRPR